MIDIDQFENDAAALLAEAKERGIPFAIQSMLVVDAPLDRIRELRAVDQAKADKIAEKIAQSLAEADV